MDLRTAIMGKRLLSLLKDTSMSSAAPFQWEEKKSRVLVLAPHYDDDILGCGGILQMHCLRRDDVDIVYFTDGCASEGSGLSKEELVSCRRMEAEKACQRIGSGIRGIHLLQPDGKLCCSKHLEETLATIIANGSYDRIYMPNPYDIHHDHKAVIEILDEALDRVPFGGELVLYEFWNPLARPNRYFSLGKFEETKLKALAEHRSQLKYVDYVELVKKLNQCRADGFGFESCEAFQIVSRSELKNMMANAIESREGVNERKLNTTCL